MSSMPGNIIEPTGIPISVAPECSLANRDAPSCFPGLLPLIFGFLCSLLILTVFFIMGDGSQLKLLELYLPTGTDQATRDKGKGKGKCC